MIIFIADDPINNSYVTSLIEAYKKQDNKVICGSRNFYLTNLIPDLLHIQWPEKIYNVYPFNTLPEPEQFNIIEERLKWFKRNKTILVHTIHNIQPHRQLKLDFQKKLFNLIINYSDILIHHCSKSIEILKNNYPAAGSKFNLVNHHPDYLRDYIELSKNDARKKLNLNLEAFLILNFGSQQKYKGESFIESVFKRLPLKHKFLLTAGEYVYDGYSKGSSLKLKIRNKIRQNINFKKRKYFYNRIKPKDLPYYLSSSDILFLGHQSGLNSGILPLAATYGKPAVFPDIGCFKEQMKNWIFETYIPGNTRDAVNAIEKLHNKINGDHINLNNSTWLTENSWELHVKKIIEAIENIKINNNVSS